VKDPELTLRSGTFDPDAEAALAWCLREAVTNVIRHADARSCRIRLIEHGPELSLEVTDDGRGFIDYDTQCPDGPDGQKGPGDQQAGQTTRGSGLRGMSGGCPRSAAACRSAPPTPATPPATPAAASVSPRL